MILLKRDSNTDLSSEYSEIFNNTYFQVEALEHEIYSCFLMSEVIHPTGKSKEGILNLFYNKRYSVKY